MKWFNHDSAFKYFNTMDSTTVATVVFAFDEKNIENTYNGTGFVIARTSHTDITACTWTTKKWPFTTPKGKVLLRAYVGKPGDTVVDDHTDEEIVNIARRDLSKMMTFKGSRFYHSESITKKYATVSYRSYDSNSQYTKSCKTSI